MLQFVFSILNSVVGKYSTFWKMVGTQIYQDWKQETISMYLDRTLFMSKPMIWSVFEEFSFPVNFSIDEYFSFLISKMLNMKTEKRLELAKWKFNIFQSFQHRELKQLSTSW